MMMHGSWQLLLVGPYDFELSGWVLVGFFKPNKHHVFLTI